MEKPVINFEEILHDIQNRYDRNHLKFIGLDDPGKLSYYIAYRLIKLKFKRPIWWWIFNVDLQNAFKEIDREELLKDFKERDAVFILDHSADPLNVISLTNSFLKDVLVFFKENNIPFNRLLVLTPLKDHEFFTKCVDTPVIKAADRTPFDLDVGHITFNRLFYDMYLGFNVMGEYRGKGMISDFEKKPDKHFLSLSRRDEFNRRLHNYMLHNNDTFKYGIVSHNRVVEGVYTNNEKQVDIALTKELVTKDDFDLNNFLDFGYRKHLLDDVSQKGRVSYDPYPHLKFSVKTCFEIVIETDWTNTWLTEKTFKPLLCKSPFLLIGPRHSLAYLRDLGFKTFDFMFDESYDDQKALYDRMIIIHKNIKKLTSLPLKDCLELVNRGKDIYDHNHSLYQNTTWDFDINNKIENYIERITNV